MTGSMQSTRNVHRKRFTGDLVWIMLLTICLCKRCDGGHSRLKLINNGYETVVIAISPDIHVLSTGQDALLERIKVFSKFSIIQWYVFSSCFV